MGNPIIKLRRGDTYNRETFIPQTGEIVLDTTTHELYVGDGETPGGILIKNGNLVAEKVIDEKLRMRMEEARPVFIIDDYEDLI
mgnify:CR=1 FL=1